MGSKSAQFSVLMSNLLPDCVGYYLNLCILGSGDPPGGRGAVYRIPQNRGCGMALFGAPRLLNNLEYSDNTYNRSDG